MSDTGIDPFMLMQLLQQGGGGFDIPQYETQAKPGGRQLPYDIGTYGMQNTAMHNGLLNTFSPELGAYGAALGFPTIDYGQSVDQAPAVPQPVEYTPYGDSLRQNYPTLYDGIQKGYTLPQLKSAAKQLATDDDEAKDLTDVVVAAQKEHYDNQRSQLEYQSKVASTPPKQTSQQKFYADAGLPDPTAQYTPEDMQVDDADWYAGAEQQAKQHEVESHGLHGQALDAQKRTIAEFQNTANLLKNAHTLQRHAGDSGHNPSAIDRINSWHLDSKVAGAMDAHPVVDKLAAAASSARDWLTGADDPKKEPGNAAVGRAISFAAANPKPKAGSSAAKSKVDPNAAWKAQQQQAKLLQEHAKMAAKQANDTRDIIAKDRDARAIAAANRRNQSGSPYTDAVRQRVALMNYLRGGGM